MAFVKLYKVIQDGPLGYQFVNQLADNSAEMRTQMLVQHGSEDPDFRTKQQGALGFDYHELGRHDRYEIPRSVATSALFYDASSATVPAYASLNLAGPGCPTIWRWGVGLYMIPVVGLSKFWASNPIVFNGSTLSFAQSRSFTAANRYVSGALSFGSASGLWISTYALSAGDFIAADMTFSFALYGEP